MYNMPDFRKTLNQYVEKSDILDYSPGLMTRANARKDEAPREDPQEAILRRVQKYRETAEVPFEEESTTGAMTEPMRPVARPRPLGKGISGDVGGRSAAEEYLGRSVSDQEWEMLVRATYAEATDDPQEQAAVMSVVLNRVKAENYPNSIVDVLNEDNQFQAVTGTSKNPGPSSRYRMLSDGVLSKFETEVTPLLSNFQDKGWLNFTAGNPAAYGEGTDINFLGRVRNAKDSLQIGGTIFGTVR
jgi:spore germination cell wall hydrolase CwlJ-like protein